MIFTTHAPATTNQQATASAITRKAILRALAYSDIFDYAKWSSHGLIISQNYVIHVEVGW